MTDLPQVLQGPDWSLVRRDSGSLVVDDLRVADTYWTKLAGLQFRLPLPAGRALLLVGDASVHTFWMRFNLDMAFIGAGGRVLSVRRNVPPWRLAFGPSGTHAVLEATSGWLVLETGVQMVAISASQQEMLRRGRSLSFLSPTLITGERELSPMMERQHA